MILICVKWKIKTEHADDWIELSRDFSEATRAEPGNLFYEWSRSVEDPTEYVLIEGFEESGAESHVTSDHFETARAELPKYLVETPHIRNIQGQPVEWDRLGEFDLG